MIKPYNSEGSKKEQVAQMFNNIAHRYDFLNHFLSVGIDKLWRRRAIKELKKIQPKRILDIATGTGDLAMASLRLHPEEIVGIDISGEMLVYAQKKIEKAGKSNIIRFEQGDSEQIQFPDDYFDAITVAFGVRNFENLEKGLSEMFRVLKPSGKVVILEFSQPQNKIVRTIYNGYFFYIVPFFGKLFSKDYRAYTYLPESVNAFPCGDNFLEFMKKAGFEQRKRITLTFGIAMIYAAVK